MKRYMAEKKKFIGFKCPESTWKKIHELAERDCRTASSYLRLVVERYLRENEGKEDKRGGK